MAYELLVVRPVRMKTVQVAIQDPGYADSIRGALLEDGNHWVHLVEMPDASLGGVIVVDTMCLNTFPLLANELERLIVLVDKQSDDLSRVWDAGVRHVLFHGDPPHMARIMVLGMELALASLEHRPLRDFTQFSAL
jgi:hypothetical protein